MDDSEIVSLFWDRDESALAVCAERYGPYLRTVASRILPSEEDCDECVNDAWFRAWNAIPPARPVMLRLFLAKIVRSLAIDRRRKDSASKRAHTEYDGVLEELADVTAGGGDPVDEAERDRLRQAIDAYVAALPRETRIFFVCRYFYSDPVADIARKNGCSEGKVKSALHRARAGLRARLEKEGFDL